MTITGERALADAERLERLGEAERAALPLFGVAYSLKDLTWTKGIRTTMGSKNFERYVPAWIRNMRRASRRPAGSCSAKPPRRNSAGVRRPRAAYARRRIIHGISSSPRAAPAAEQRGGRRGTGSDRRRQRRRRLDSNPRPCCGLVGIKPARGRVSFAPAMGEGWGGFATIGPLARSVRDAALLLDVMAGPSRRPVLGDATGRSLRRRGHATSTEAAARGDFGHFDFAGRWRKCSARSRHACATFRAWVMRSSRSRSIRPRRYSISRGN